MKSKRICWFFHICCCTSLNSSEMFSCPPSLSPFLNVARHSQQKIWWRRYWWVACKYEHTWQGIPSSQRGLWHDRWSFETVPQFLRPSVWKAYFGVLTSCSYFMFLEFISHTSYLTFITIRMVWVFMYTALSCFIFIFFCQNKTHVSHDPFRKAHPKTWAADRGFEWRHQNGVWVGGGVSLSVSLCWSRLEYSFSSRCKSSRKSYLQMLFIVITRSVCMVLFCRCVIT